MVKMIKTLTTADVCKQLYMFFMHVVIEKILLLKRGGKKAYISHYEDEQIRLLNVVGLTEENQYYVQSL